MKIKTRRQLMDMPSQTLYSEYKPDVFDFLHVKVGEPDPDAVDFYYEDMQWVKCRSSQERGDILHMAKETGSSFKMDLESTSRDGMFDDDQLYMVYEKEDVAQLIERLKKCL